MTWLLIKATLPRLASTALEQTAAAARAAMPAVGWSVAAMTSGLIIGLAAVVLPPTGAFGIAAAAGLVLLWSLPDLPAIPDKMVRRLMFVALVVDICVPDYYTIDVPGLPWISVRRIVTAPLIVLFAITVSGSSSVRSRLVKILGDSPIVTACVIGYGVMAFLSIFTSVHPSSSVSALVNAILVWYVPFFSVLYVVQSEKDALTLVRVLSWCAIFVAGVGVVDFVQHKTTLLAIMPKGLVNSIAAGNPMFMRMLTYEPIRNGMFRAQSSYNTPLSFGEFEAMMVPLGYFLVMHSTGFRDRLFGVVVVSACWIGIFCSGARGGYQSAIVATGFFAALWGVRTALFDRRSLMPALLALVWIMGAASLVGLLVVSTRIRNVVVGGGHESYSTQARWEQWAMAQPHIAANPITGHGFGLGAEVVGYHMDAATLGGTLDSYVISTLVETGIPGFVFFFGMIIAAMSRGVQRYLLDPSRSGAFAGALGCSLLAFGYYRIALSQAENHTLFYVIVGLVMAVWHDRRLDQDQTAKIW